MKKVVERSRCGGKLQAWKRKDATKQALAHVAFGAYWMDYYYDGDW